VQVLEPAEGTALARLANDRLAAACRRYPDRFAGLTVFAPQDVMGSVAEIERGMKSLGMNGAVINSHFRGHYLDEEAYWPILEALQANDAALYIHPTIPPKQWSQPYEFRGFGGALAGFSHEVWMHVMGLIMSGAFDRFPDLRVVIGHMGEGMPLLLYRFDWMQSNADGRPGLRDGAAAVTLRHKISHYFKKNIWITTSGQGWEPSVKLCMDVWGPIGCSTPWTIPTSSRPMKSPPTTLRPQRRAQEDADADERGACLPSGTMSGAMNYRHIYHAGNFADVAKHVALMYCLGALQRKDSALFVLHSHAGRGSYDLQAAEANKSAEAERGLQRLIASTLERRRWPTTLRPFARGAAKPGALSRVAGADRRRPASAGPRPIRRLDAGGSAGRRARGRIPRPDANRDRRRLRRAQGLFAPGGTPRIGADRPSV
jgi:hypothetical protein